MPPYNDDESSSIRRSRRLSKQEPKNYYEGPQGTSQSQPSNEAPNITSLSLSPTSEVPPSHLFPGFAAADSFGPGRASHPRRRPKGHPPRPPNAFMLFRSDFWAREKQKETPIERDHRDISRIAGHCWNNLGEEERTRYRELAAQRKEMHHLEHPGYKYVPSVRRERAVKRKPKKGAEDEEERCRKLASFVMQGLSHADLREAMKCIEEKPAGGVDTRMPSAGPSRPRRRSFRTHTYRPTRNVVKVEKNESPLPSGRLFDASDVCTAEASVPMEQACNLDASIVKKEEEELTLESYLRPLSYDAVDSHFGFNPAQSPSLSPDCYLWYNYDEGNAANGVPPLPSIPDATFDFGVDFTNPFSHFGNGGPLAPALDQPREAYGGSFSAFTMPVDPLASGTCDSEMSQYFHFDF